MMKIAGILSILFVALVAASARNQLPDVLASLDGDHRTANIIEPLDNIDNMVEPTCNLEIQVVQTKKVNGRCIKLRGGAPGCVSGSYLHPFHPDCLVNL